MVDMDKHLFMEQVIEFARSIPLSQVIGTKIDLVKRGGNHKGLCPFHNDQHLGAFVITDKKGIWKCFSCGVGGDAPKFISLMEGVDYVEASFRLALNFGRISILEYHEYFERRRYNKNQVQKIEKRYTDLDKSKTENHRAEDKILDQVYRIFIKHAGTLNEEHKAHLNDVRKLTDSDIKDGLYFTFPTRRILKEFTAEICEVFGNDDVLGTIPGFYREKDKNRFTFVRYTGIGIGIQNANGLVIGIQIRRDEKKEGQSRYIWFSSDFVNFYDNSELGTSSGSPIDVIYPKILKTRVVFVTEGRFKAQKIAERFGSIAISVQGITTWRGILNVLKVLSESIQPILGYLFQIKCIILAFDADMSYKVQVFEQAKILSNYLEQNNYPVYYSNWDDRFGKGIDDVLNNNHPEAIKRYDKIDMDNQYDKMIQDILEHEKEWTNIKKVPQEIVRKYFEKDMNLIPLGHNQMSERHIRITAK